jgi:hypothetical protein
LLGSGANESDNSYKQATYLSDIYEALSHIHQILQPEFYLEIGVGRGKSLALAKCRAVGIDPVPQERVTLGENTQIITATSDEFFSYMAEDYISQPPDLALLDGMPLLDYTLRDFMAVEAVAALHTLILVPGIFPHESDQATIYRTGLGWVGNVWKLPGILKRYRPDLELLLVDTEPSGLLIVAGVDPNNTELSQSRERLDAEIRDPGSPPADIMQRTGGVTPNNPLFLNFLDKHLKSKNKLSILANA